MTLGTHVSEPVPVTPSLADIRKQGMKVYICLELASMQMAASLVG